MIQVLPSKPISAPMTAPMQDPDSVYPIIKLQERVSNVEFVAKGTDGRLFTEGPVFATPGEGNGRD